MHPRLRHPRSLLFGLAVGVGVAALMVLMNALPMGGASPLNAPDDFTIAALSAFAALCGYVLWREYKG